MDTHKAVLRSINFVLVPHHPNHKLRNLRRKRGRRILTTSALADTRRPNDLVVDDTRLGNRVPRIATHVRIAPVNGTIVELAITVVIDGLAPDLVGSPDNAEDLDLGIAWDIQGADQVQLRILDLLVGNVFLGLQQVNVLAASVLLAGKDALAGSQLVKDRDALPDTLPRLLETGLDASDADTVAVVEEDLGILADIHAAVVGRDDLQPRVGLRLLGDVLDLLLEHPALLLEALGQVGDFSPRVLGILEGLSCSLAAADHLIGNLPLCHVEVGDNASQADLEVGERICHSSQ